MSQTNLQKLLKIFKFNKTRALSKNFKFLKIFFHPIKQTDNTINVLIKKIQKNKNNRFFDDKSVLKFQT